MTQAFTQLLLKWNNSSNHRPMPWKGEKDPYKIWLSEIILQQTRVEQGWAYYEKFVNTYLTVHDLANAKEEKVLKLWEGLGYYNRCKNLIFTARYISKKLNGVFPNNYESLLSLKGVGPYTASAIASFAYNLPYAVVDGNVFRVLARFYGIHTPTDTQEGIHLFNKIADENLSKKQAGVYNQALMDFGATVCKPSTPNCGSCVMQKKCVAFLNNQVNQLPIKVKSIERKKRHFDFFCFFSNGKWLVQKRLEGDIWGGLYQFYLNENKSVPTVNLGYLHEVLVNQLGISSKEISIPLKHSKQNYKLVSPSYNQALTHQLLQARFILVKFDTIPAVFSKALWVNQKQLKQLPFPKIINQFLRQDFINWCKT
jgi:A/G-specific adenine glycosylase